MTEKVHVDLGARAYDIYVGDGLLEASPQYLQPFLARNRVAIVTDETVAKLHLPTLKEVLEGAGIETAVLVLPVGEATKSWRYLTETVEWLLAEKVERRDVVIALGGGVIGDLVGFAAAILRRGVSYVQMPTTLLSQVDSSVGGKTAINSPHGKNLIGSFHQPALVLADISVLGTLEPRDFLAGYGEVAKYGLLGDADFFEWLEKNGPALRDGDLKLRTEAVRWSCQMKADIVERDETEQGDRALLNLGHTFGHALEAATGYSDRLLHGEGVSIGCVLAFELSARLGICSQELPSRVRQHFATMRMRRDLAEIPGELPDVEGLVALMGQDKKVIDGQLRFILAKDIGQAFVADDVPNEAVGQVLADAMELRAAP